MNNELTPTSILSLLDTTKEQRKLFVDQVVETITSGTHSPLKTKLQVKCMEEVCKAINENKDFKEAVLQDAINHGKSYEFHNAKVDVRSAAGKYDYSADVEWASLKAQITAREKYLKSLPPEGIQRVTTDGEVVTDYPPVYSAGEETVFITLK